MRSRSGPLPLMYRAYRSAPHRRRVRPRLLPGALVHLQARKVEVYGSTSYVFGDRDAGYSTSDERVVGLNYFPLDTRNVRVNAQLIDIDGSTVNSVFGYYEAPEALMRPRHALGW